MSKFLRQNSVFTEEYSIDGNEELAEYLILLLGFQRLLARERKLTTAIIPSTLHCMAFILLAHEPMGMIVNDAKWLTSRILQNVEKKNSWSAALGIFSVLKDIIRLQPDINEICDSVQKNELLCVLDEFQLTVSVFNSDKKKQIIYKFIIFFLLEPGYLFFPGHCGHLLSYYTVSAQITVLSLQFSHSDFLEICCTTAPKSLSLFLLRKCYSRVFIPVLGLLILFRTLLLSENAYNWFWSDVGDC